MKVMVLVKASKESEAGEMPSEAFLSAMGQFSEELVKAGVMLADEGLHPASRAKRVRFSGVRRTVIDGPFAETKELLAGFWLWQVRSIDEAVEWVKRCPNPMPEETDKIGCAPGSKFPDRTSTTTLSWHMYCRSRLRASDRLAAIPRAPPAAAAVEPAVPPALRPG